VKKLIATSALANVLIVAVVWAFEVFVAKLALLAGASVATFTIQTYIVTFMLLLLYVSPIVIKELKKMPKNTFWQLMIANGLHNGLGEFFSYIGILFTTAINAGFLLQFTTVTTSTLAWIVLKEKMTKSKAITIIAIMIGTFLLITKGRLDILHIGDLILLFACLCWSSGNVLIRKTLKQTAVNPDIISFLRPIAGVPIQLVFVYLAPLYPLAARSVFIVHWLDFRFALFVLLHGLLVAVLWIFLNRTLKLASASYMTMMTSLTPLLVAILAMVFLHETLAPIQWLGVLIILSSSLVTQYLKIDRH